MVIIHRAPNFELILPSTSQQSTSESNLGSFSKCRSAFTSRCPSITVSSCCLNPADCRR